MAHKMGTDLIAWRRFLHQRPELSGDEVNTAAYVQERLRGLAPDALVTGLGGHGVLAQFCGSDPKIRILIRCELDGLPITEINTFEHRSLTEGYGHLCGHDGHMAILMGVAEALSEQRINGLDIVLLFQPAEETGAGAKAVLDTSEFQNYQPDFAISLHNMPSLPLGQIQIKPGPFSCASRGLHITLKGKTAHASQPETGLSPATAMMEIMTGLQALNLPTPAGEIPQKMATLTHARLGDPTFGVAPGSAEIQVTLRTVLDADMDSLIEDANSLVLAACKRAGLQHKQSYHDVFPASTNDPRVAQAIQTAAIDLGIQCQPQPQPMRWSEDFGRFQSVCRSAMFLLGAGEKCPALHNPDYDFPDELIEVGVTAFLGILRELQK